VDRHIDGAPQRLQLLDSSWAVRISRYEERPLPQFPQVYRQLGCHGGLARTLQPDQHKHDGRLATQVQPGRLTEQGNELLIHDLDDHLGWRERTNDTLADGPLGHAIRELLNHAKVDVSLQQGEANVTQAGPDVGL